MVLSWTTGPTVQKSCWTIYTSNHQMSMFSQFFGQHLGIPGYQFFVGQPEVHQARTKRHILICCGQMRSTSSELWRSSKQAPPSPWVRPSHQVPWMEIQLNWIWIGYELDMMLRNRNKFSGFSTCCQIWHRLSHFVSCIMPQNASSGLWLSATEPSGSEWQNSVTMRKGGESMQTP